MAANFFEQQEQARTATKRLVVLYILAVLSIMTIITMVTHVLFNNTRAKGGIAPQITYGPDLAMALFVLATILIGTVVRMAQLGGSGEAVATMLGGTPVDPATKDPLERRLMNVVEEMAIASGIAVPRVFVLQDEPGINAFAAGLKPGQAVVAVTRGTLEQLTRDELQGVVAHEFSHIFNGDMRLNLRLMGVLGGILAIATIGRLMFQFAPSSRRSSDDDSKGSGNLFIILGLVLFVLGYIGVFFARLIKAAVSRQREYLADASSVQYTRNPEGIGGALMKIRGYEPSSKIQSHYAEEASHMFFGSALDFSSIFATHPPLEDRIARVSPALLKNGGWEPRPATDGLSAGDLNSRALATDDSTGASSVAAGPDASSMVAGLDGSSLRTRSRSERVRNAGAPDVPMSASKSASKSAAAIVSSIGAPGEADVQAARSLLDSIPMSIRERTRDRQSAVFLVISLFLESDGGTPEQVKILNATLGSDEVREVLEIRSELNSVGETDRLSLLALSLPPLRQLTETSKQMLVKMSQDLVNADGEVDLYEYVALVSLEHQLLRDLKSRKPRPVITSQRTVNDLSILMSAIAYAGADDITQAKAAFDTGASHISSTLRQTLELRPVDECRLSIIADAIERLSYLEPGAQQVAIEACVKAIVSDGQVTTKESELLRGLCAVMEAPLPALSV